MHAGTTPTRLLQLEPPFLMKKDAAPETVDGHGFARLGDSGHIMWTGAACLALSSQPLCLSTRDLMFIVQQGPYIYVHQGPYYLCPPGTLLFMSTRDLIFIVHQGPYVYDDSRVQIACDSRTVLLRPR